MNRFLWNLPISNKNKSQISLLLKIGQIQQKYDLNLTWLCDIKNLPGSPIYLPIQENHLIPINLLFRIIDKNKINSCLVKLFNNFKRKNIKKLNSTNNKILKKLKSIFNNNNHNKTKFSKLNCLNFLINKKDTLLSQ